MLWEDDHATCVVGQMNENRPEFMNNKYMKVEKCKIIAVQQYQQQKEK